MPKPTTARVHRCIAQSGENEGKPTKNHVFVFNPRYGLNDKAVEAIKEHRLGKDEVSSFKKDLKGFMIKVYSPKQAQDMHAALRKLDDGTAATLELAGLVAPEITAITVSNLDLPASGDAPEQDGVTAIMLDGFTYPLYKVLRALKYDFVRNVHGKEGINRWVRVVGEGESATALEKEVTEALLKYGWSVDTAAGDAADWESDDEQEEVE